MGRIWGERLEAVDRSFYLIAAEVPGGLKKERNRDLISLLEILERLPRLLSRKWLVEKQEWKKISREKWFWLKFSANNEDGENKHNGNVYYRNVQHPCH